MNTAIAVTAMMISSSTRRNSVSTVRTYGKVINNTEPKTHGLYEVRKGKGGKTVLAVYKTEKAAERKAAELGGHVVARFVTLAEYNATTSTAAKK